MASACDTQAVTCVGKVIAIAYRHDIPTLQRQHYIQSGQAKQTWSDCCAVLSSTDAGGRGWSTQGMLGRVFGLSMLS